jgi:hypothetical protein
MSYTAERWEQGSSNPDLQIFVGASEFKDVAGLATIASAGAGLLSWHVPATDASTFFADVTAMLKRTGVFAEPLWSGFTGTLGTGTANAGASQEAFGTAAAAPGPSTVANTRGISGLPPGHPPQPAATLATLTGGVNGPQPKGFQITSIDVIYSVAALAAAAATVGVTDTVFVSGVAPVVTNRIALAANGLPTAIGGAAGPYVTNVPVAAPVFPIAADTETIVNVNLTGGATGTVNFYGVVLHVAYNLN